MIKYKEIFDNVSPSDELIDSIILSKKKKNNIKPFMTVCIVFTLVSIIGLTAYFCFSKEIIKDTDVINLIVAYETKKNSRINYRISKKLNNGNKNIMLDADVIIEGNINEMGVYKVNETVYSADEIWEIICGKDRLYKGDLKNANVLFPDGCGINFSTNIDNKYKSNFLKGDGYANGCNISYDDAKKIADEFLVRKKNENFKFVKGEISDSRFYGNGYSNTGFYIFSYIQYADGFPIETVSSNVYNGIASELSIYVNDDGIFYLRLCGLDYIEKSEIDGDIMTVDEAVDRVEKSLNDLWLTEYAPIVEIRLEYILNQLDDNTLELVPCWHFCIDETELKKMDFNIQRENDTNDLCINALTGEMFRVANRYPVYQLSDGSIYSTYKS